MHIVSCFSNLLMRRNQPNATAAVKGSSSSSSNSSSKKRVHLTARDSSVACLVRWGQLGSFVWTQFKMQREQLGGITETVLYLAEGENVAYHILALEIKIHATKSVPAIQFR
jgi:hypothetical protein